VFRCGWRFSAGLLHSGAQSLGYDTKVGLMTRMERYLVLAPSLVLNIPLVGLWIIAIFANITALQRIIDIRRQAHASRKSD
jgi:CDP-diacylglycerol--glycerol-3-phosphate 3-phosphatidyltransferase